MKKEVCSAVDFLTQLMRSSTKDQDQLEAFNESLKLKVCGHYQDHWFPAKPFKGSGYRCLRINHQMEPIILQAAAECGLTKEDLISMLPNELTLWIDPREVSYRIGEDGSVGILYQEEDDGSHSKPAPQTKAPSPVPASRSPPVSHPSPHPVNHLSHSPVSMNMNAMNVQTSMNVQNVNLSQNLSQNVSLTQRHSPVSLSPSRTSPVHHSPVHSPVPLHFNSPQRRLHSPSPADFISWDMFEPSLSPSRGYQQPAPQHYYQRQQQCGKDAYFQQHNFNDSYDLKRLAAFVYS